MTVQYRSIALMAVALTWISAASAGPYDVSAKKAVDWLVQQRNPVDASRAALAAAQAPSLEEARQELGALAPVLFEANMKVALVPVASGDWITAGYSVRASVCVIGYNPLSNSASLFLSGTLGERKILLRAALVHEMAHCYESRMAIAHPEHAQLVNPALRASFAGVERWELVKNLPKAVLWREILADFAMVSYLSAYHGELGVALARCVTRARLSNASRDPGHATGPYLQQVDRAQLEAGPLFEQALVTRNSLAVQ